MNFLLLAMALLSVPNPPPLVLTAENMEARLRAEDDGLHVSLEANTTGWVLLGLNGRDELGGSRLFMARVVDGVAQVEEHIADPPNHAARPGVQVVSAAKGAESKGVTRVSFSIPWDPAGPGSPIKAATGGTWPGTALSADGRYWVTLAWSHSDDLQHHSAMRTARWSKLR